MKTLTSKVEFDIKPARGKFALYPIKLFGLLGLTSDDKSDMIKALINISEEKEKEFFEKFEVLLEKTSTVPVKDLYDGGELDLSFAQIQEIISLSMGSEETEEEKKSR